MTTTEVDPRRGEVWLADLEPSVGDEINKTRRVVVISADSHRALRLRLAAPITGLTPSKLGKIWLVPLQPSAANGLTKDSVVDVLQVRGLSVKRFVKRKGRVRDEDLDEIVAALAMVVQYT